MDGLQLLEQKHGSVAIIAACCNAALAKDYSCGGKI
jgi:hypothetical protein